MEKSTPPALKILFAAAEAFPFVKVGGLADVTGSLPAALHSLPASVTGGQQVDVRLAIPFHAVIPRDLPGLERAAELSVQRSTGPISAVAYRVVQDGVTVYLIDGDPIPRQGPVYSIDTQKDGEKFIFFSLAVLELCRAIDWHPDVIHAHDWHAAISLHELVRRRREDVFYASIRGLFTVHNLPYMGAGTDQALSAYQIPPSNENRLPPWGTTQPLPMGLAAADFITAVSPTYAREIMTPEFGCGLETFLQSRADSVRGILNGLDTTSYDPSRDSHISIPYSAENLETRARNKRALQREFGLSVSSEIPLLILISRFDYQKGIDLAVNALSQITNQSWQAVLLGSGDPVIEATAQQLENDLPDRVRVVVRYDAALSRRMYAGGDMLLMPSRYEPCGLTQMIAMRYGCIPVARATGGLVDTIQDNEETASNTGFLFSQASVEGLASAFTRAINTFSNPENWTLLQRNAMNQDFSWSRSAASYYHLYKNLEQGSPK